LSILLIIDYTAYMTHAGYIAYAAYMTYAGYMTYAAYMAHAGYMKLIAPLGLYFLLFNIFRSMK